VVLVAALIAAGLAMFSLPTKGALTFPIWNWNIFGTTGTTGGTPGGSGTIGGGLPSIIVKNFCLPEKLTSDGSNWMGDVTKNYTVYTFLPFYKFKDIKNLTPENNPCTCSFKDPASENGKCSKICSVYGTAGNSCDGDNQCRAGKLHTNDSNIFVYDFTAKTEIPIAQTDMDEMYPSTYGSKVVYFVPGNVLNQFGIVTPTVIPGKIFLYDISTGQRTQVASTNDSYWVLPRIYDDSIVWGDANKYNFTWQEIDLTTGGFKNVTGEKLGEWRIFVYNIPLNRTDVLPVGVEPHLPDIYGEKIVYETSIFAPNNNVFRDIGFYDRSTKTETLLGGVLSWKNWPMVSENMVVWEQQGDIMTYDFAKKVQLKMSSNAFSSSFHDVSNGFVVWSEVIGPANLPKSNKTIKRNLTTDSSRFLENISSQVGDYRQPAEYGPITVFTDANAGEIYKYLCPNDIVPDIPKCRYFIPQNLAGGGTYSKLTMTKNNDGTASYTSSLNHNGCLGRLLQLKKDNCNGTVVDECTIGPFYSLPPILPNTCNGVFNKPLQNGTYKYVLCDPREGQASTVASLVIP